MMSGEPPLKRYHDLVMRSELVDDEVCLKSNPLFRNKQLTFAKLIEDGAPLEAYRDLIKRVEMRDPNINDYDRPRESDYWNKWKIAGEGYALPTYDILQRRYQTAIDHLLDGLQVSEDLKDILRSCWEVDPDERPTIEEIADDLAAILEALGDQIPEAM